MGAWQTWPMNRDTLSDQGYRLPPAIINHAVWLSHRVGVSIRAVEDGHRGLTVSYAATRLWCLTVGSVDTRRLTRRQGGRLGDIGPLDEGFVTLQDQRRSLWRAVDQAGDVLDSLVQSRRDCRAATRLFRTLLQGQARPRGGHSLHPTGPVGPAGLPVKQLCRRLYFGCAMMVWRR